MKAPRVVPVGRVATGVLSFISQNQPQAAIVAKATFALTPFAPMTRIDAEAVVVRDEPRDKNPTKSLLFASELVPYLGCGELRLQGTVRVPRGRDTFVGVTVTRGNQTILKKHARIRPSLGAAAKAGGEMVEVPLVYELAYGKAGFAANPVGTTNPSIFHPTEPEVPTGFSPIPRYWRARGDLLRPGDRAAIKKRVPELTNGFKHEFFQAVPVDQRISGFFTGTETLVLDRLMAQGERVQTSLPNVKALALLLVRGQPSRRVHLHADILSVDLDRGLCSLVFRTVLPLVFADNVRPLLVVGVASAGEDIDLDSVDPRKIPDDAPASAALPGNKTQVEDEETVAVRVGALAADTLPFVVRKNDAAVPSSLVDDEMDMTVAGGSAPRGPILPFEGGQASRDAPKFEALRAQAQRQAPVNALVNQHETLDPKHVYAPVIAPALVPAAASTPVAAPIAAPPPVPVPAPITAPVPAAVAVVATPAPLVVDAKSQEPLILPKSRATELIKLIAERYAGRSL